MTLCQWISDVDEWITHKLNLIDDLTCSCRNMVLPLLKSLTFKDILKKEMQTDHKQIALGRLTGRCVQKGWWDEHKQQRQTAGIGCQSTKVPAIACSSHTTVWLC